VRTLLVVAFAVAAAALGGCRSVTVDPPIEPTPCITTFSRERCDAIVVWVTGELGLQPSGIDGVDVIDQRTSVTLRVHLPDGPAREVMLSCGGISRGFRAECMDDPAVPLVYATGPDGGYRDTPEGATQFPDLDPVAAAATTPLLIPRRTISIDRPGTTRIVLGQASLANGIIQESSFELADDWPDSVVLRGSIGLEITPAVGGDPIWNIYEHGWHEGIELVDVAITFDAAILRAGASFEIVNLVVR
jgi:hypothetical protein